MEGMESPIYVESSVPASVPAPLSRPLDIAYVFMYACGRGETDDNNQGNGSPGATLQTS